MVAVLEEAKRCYLPRRKEEKIKTVSLRTYLAGLGPEVDFNKVLLSGEDLARNVLKISIYDLAGWIKAGAKVEIMPREDRKILKDYFRKVDLRRK